MSFRESINNLISSDKPESTSRVLALVTGISAIGWIWYALIWDKTGPLVSFLAIVLAYITALLVGKQITENKKDNPAGKENGNA